MRGSVSTQNDKKLEIDRFDDVGYCIIDRVGPSWSNNKDQTKLNQRRTVIHKQTPDGSSADEFIAWSRLQ
jgi:hypothetical protein